MRTGAKTCQDDEAARDEMGPSATASPRATGSDRVNNRSTMRALQWWLYCQNASNRHDVTASERRPVLAMREPAAIEEESQLCADMQPLNSIVRDVSGINVGDV